ncbi:FtsX-like permease family protein [bacterium]|nr:FtsX-like permease family protein [bacterium]
MRHLFRLASIRRIVEHPVRTVLTILGIALGVAAYISVRMILDTMSDSYASMIDTVAGKARLQITGGEAGVSEDAWERLSARDDRGGAAVEGVVAALPTIQYVTRHGAESVLILAVDTLNDAAARDYKMRGKDDVEISDPLEFLNSTDSILLNRDFARRHRIEIDDRIDLLTSAGKKSFAVRGLLEPEGPAATFGGNFALMDVFAAQALFGRGRTFDSIDLVLAEGAALDAVKERVEAFLGGQYDVQRPEQRSEGVDSMMNTFRMGLTILALVVLAMGGFIILNTVTTTIYQRMREIGVLRMVGTTRARLWAMFLSEGAVLGLAGSLIGVAAGFFAGRHAVLTFSEKVSSLFVATNTQHAEFTTDMAVYGTLLGVGVSLIGAAWPSYRATTITPLEVLRFGPGLSRGRGALMGWWVSIFALACGLIAAGLFVPPFSTTLNGVRTTMVSIIVAGVSATPLVMFAFLHGVVRATARLRTPLARLSSENILRDLGRSAMTVAAFMVALAVFFQIYIFMNSTKAETRGWLGNVLKADLLVTSSADFATRTSVPIDAALSARIRTVPGVDTVRHVRFRLIDYKGARISVLSLEFNVRFERDRFRFAEGDPEKALPLFFANEGVFISKTLVIKNPELDGARAITLNTPAGRREFPILAVVHDFLSEEGLVFMNRPLYLASFNDPLVDTFQVYLSPGADAADVRRGIDARLGDNFNLFILTNTQFRESIIDAIDQIFTLAVSLEIITMLIAIIGIVNNLLANVIDRTREIGVLRSLGATRRQVATIFFMQSGMLGLSGATVALACGYFLGHVQMTRLNAMMSGWAMPIVINRWYVVAAFFGAVLLAIAAGLLPARKAAGLPMREALKYE